MGIGEMGAAVCLSLTIGLELVLEQAQIQLSQCVGTQSTSIVVGVVANQRDLLQMV